jgi:hypothetical protein
MSDEHLLLKWGTLKGWGDLRGNQAAVEAWKRYHAEPVSLGVMSQRDTDAQKQALCDLIDAVNGPIENDWSGEIMTKDEAKKYVMEYRR